jgi:transcriptional regulator with XRE-family HTH domain
MPKDYSNQRAKKQPPVAGIPAIRAALGLTQIAVCERVAAITNKTFTKGALSAIEGGHRGASAETLAALETALGMPPKSLLVTYEVSHNRRKVDAA